jgi:membrane protein DedA with SNARE-associated domain
MGMPYPRFLLLDSLGVLVSVPLSIYLGKVFGGSVDTLKEKVHDVHLILAFLALSLALILFLRYRRHGSRTAEARALRDLEARDRERPPV